MSVPDIDGVDSGDLLARCTFPVAGTPVDLAVSGGPDSMAMMVLAVRAGLVVTAHQVDHGLRPGSATEAEAVRQAAASLGASFVSHTVELDDGPDLEQRARRARYRVLPTDVMTGHTADDQAETLVLALFRGSGPWGLGAMEPGLRHPILGLRRAETHAFCRSLGLAVVEDPTNTDPRFRRNRVRNELLPLANEVFERDVVPILSRSAEQFRELAAFVDECASAVDVTDARALSAAARPVAIAAVRRWWRDVTGLDHPPDAAAIGRILDVAAGQIARADVVAGWYVRRQQQRLTLFRYDHA